MKIIPVGWISQSWGLSDVSAKLIVEQSGRKEVIFAGSLLDSFWNKMYLMSIIETEYEVLKVAYFKGLFLPWSVALSKLQQPPFDLAAPESSKNQLFLEKFYPESTNFDWLQVLPVAWFCPKSNYFFFQTCVTNLDWIWAIDRDFVFFAVRVFDLEFVIFESINQHSMRFIVEKFWQGCHYNVTIIEGVLKFYLALKISHFLTKKVLPWDL